MSTYITRKGQILYALADNVLVDNDDVRLAPYYVDKTLDDWELDGKLAFEEFVGRILGGGDWEYNGSSSWNEADPSPGMTVAVYSSSVADFAGDQIDALEAHPDTVFYGYLHFVDQGMRYSNAVVDLADIAAPRLCSSELEIKEAFDAVYDAAREHNDPLADIVDALVGTAWDYDRSVGELSRRVREAA